MKRDGSDSFLKKQINYWLKLAEEDWRAAQGLFKLKHYSACLFFCHLALEKILKALVVQRTQQPAPYLHDLERLALLAKISLTKNQRKYLKTITKFNIAARYDNIKLAFHKRCTPSYTRKYFKITKNLYQWLKKEFQKK